MRRSRRRPAAIPDCTIGAYGAGHAPAPAPCRPSTRGPRRGRTRTMPSAAPASGRRRRPAEAPRKSDAESARQASPARAEGLGNAERHRMCGDAIPASGPQAQLKFPLPAPSSKSALAMPVSISVNMPPEGLARTLPSSFSSKKKFCLFMAVGAFMAASTPSLNH